MPNFTPCGLILYVNNSHLNNLIIDIGNSRIKAALFEAGTLIEDWTIHAMAEIDDIAKKVDFQYAIVSSVRWDQHHLKEKLSFPFSFFDHFTPLPVQNTYETPFTLGLDRIASVIGARCFQAQGAVLVVDLGTCITYEFMDSADKYHGGSISPGIRMRFEAMHRQTAKLPLVEWPLESVPLIGKSTKACMQSGVYHGVYQELLGVVQAYRDIYPEVGVYICGGDAKHFESLTKQHIFVIPNLVLYGLDRILTYNVDKIHA